jgi:nucleotide-binding universal stress UspA family protein
MLNIRKILAATDLSEKSLPGVKYAISLAKQRGVQLQIVYVADDPRVPTLSLNYVEGELLVPGQWTWFEEKRNGSVEAEIMKADRRLATFVERHVDPEMLASVPLKRVPRLGDVAEEIVTAAIQEECDLIVMSSRGRAWLRRMISGSLCEKVARMAPCPVLTIQPSVWVRDDGRLVPVESMKLAQAGSAA